MGIKVREKKLADGRVSLYLDIYYQGRRSYEFLELYLTKNRQKNKELKELAENIRSKKQIELSSSGYGVTPQHKKKVDFLKYFEKFADEKVKNEGIRAAGLYQYTLKHLKEFANNQPVLIGTITKEWVESFKSFLSSKMQQNTANNYYGKVKSALRLAHKEGFINRNPAEDVKFYPSPEVEKEFLTIEEIELLAKTPCRLPDVKRAFLFGCYTGLRFSDIKNLKWGDIQDGRIHFRQEKTTRFEYMPLNETALSIIRQCKAENEIPLAVKPVFNIPDKSHISTTVKPWVEKAGITKRITFHCSRHTFATSLLTAGNDLYTTQKLLGHKSIASTAVYAKIVDAKKVNAVNSLPVINVS